MQQLTLISLSKVNAVVQRVQVLGKAIPDLIYTLASNPGEFNKLYII